MSTVTAELVGYLIDYAKHNNWDYIIPGEGKSHLVNGAAIQFFALPKADVTRKISMNFIDIGLDLTPSADPFVYILRGFYVRTTRDSCIVGEAKVWKVENYMEGAKISSSDHLRTLFKCYNLQAKIMGCIPLFKSL